MRIFTTTIFSILMTFSLFGQREETVLNRFGDIEFTGFWAGSTNALVDFNNDININSGGFVAFELNENFLIGWSGYKSDITNGGQDVEITGNDLFLGYTFNSRRVIHPLTYLQIGSGRLELEDVGSDRIFVAQPTIGAEVNIARFFRLSVDGGYRFVSGNELPTVSNDDLAGPVLNVRLKFGWSWK